jgi:phosphatidylserine/phosphatidylglycerophosphate/cardiolipin synthase-like enzyme
MTQLFITPRWRQRPPFARFAGKIAASCRELAACGGLVTKWPAMDWELPARPVTSSLLSGAGHYARVIEPLSQARRSVWIATANLKELMVEDERVVPGRRRSRRRANYRSVLEVFDELAERGVELRILHARLPSRAFRDALDRHPRLWKGGLKLRMCPRVHLKTVIVDGTQLYLGSANWTGAGLGAKGEHRRNFELGVVTDDERWLDAIQDLYEHIWRGAGCAKCRLRETCEAPLDLKAPE